MYNSNQTNIHQMYNESLRVKEEQEMLQKAKVAIVNMITDYDKEDYQKVALGAMVDLMEQYIKNPYAHLDEINFLKSKIQSYTDAMVKANQSNNVPIHEMVQPKESHPKNKNYNK